MSKYISIKPFPILSLLILLLIAPTAIGQPPSVQPSDIHGCIAIENDALRLSCYDKAAGHDSTKASPAAHTPQADTLLFTAKDRITPAGTSSSADTHSLLDRRWELTPESKLGTFTVRGYKPVYLLPFFATTRRNNLPQSPNPDNRVTVPLQMDNIEGKFQLSLKTKLWQNIFGNYGDLWFGYTQSSHWQVYNRKISRPFRETNYEPEALLVFATHYKIGGWSAHMLAIGINHQSNGQANPLSRSWNRIVANIGLEKPGWVVMLRPWWRIHEKPENDDNPDIANYIGRGEIQIVHEWHGQEFGLLLRHSLRGGHKSHGAGQFTWSFPLQGNLRGYLELFKGYGESLIDYNYNATYLGLGIALLDWY